MVETIEKIIKTPEEFNKITKISFDNLDVNKSNYLGKDELNNVIKRISSEMGFQPLKPQDIEEVFKGLDLDGDGKIDYKEFSLLIKKVLLSLIKKEENEEKEEDNE